MKHGLAVCIRQMYHIIFMIKHLLKTHMKTASLRKRDAVVLLTVLLVSVGVSTSAIVYATELHELRQT